ncbi:MAG: hypothetical protein ACU0BB_10075 [Paracoccaceae bacterium]
MTRHQMINWGAIPILALATALGIYWIWGLLFLGWSIHGLRSGRVFLLGTIEKHTDPHLYWIVTGAWAGFGLWYLLDLVNQL